MPGQPVSRPYPLGLSAAGPGPDAAARPLRIEDDRVNLAVYAPGCARLDLVHTRADFPAGVVPTAADLTRVPLPQVREGVHCGTVVGLGPGALYGLVPRDRSVCLDTTVSRGAAEQDPVLLDPHGAAVTERGGRLWSVRVAPDFDWGQSRRPGTDLQDTVIYEAHVVGQTRLHPGIPDHLRGTYAGLAHPVMIEHLHRLGVSAVELLPIHHHADERHLQRLGLSNYWGYNTVGFFAPHPGYATAQAQAAGPQAVQDEVKGMIRLLHEAGIEVYLDVVYNHTAEEGADGPTFCWRGLGERAYYRHDEHGAYLDTTGCGNTLDFSHPRVVQLGLDSLRHWVQEYRVDGFRFDLAVSLARDAHHHFTPDHPFLVAAGADPALAGTKLIAEPWDISAGGWQTGRFPRGWSDWNDRFRDTVREFWLRDRSELESGGTPGPFGPLADVLSGTAGLFADSGRAAPASVNLVTAHDGFTLADLVGYEHKHNEANGEHNRDGTTANRAFNHGVEGPTSDPAVRAVRALTVRNLMATLLLSRGVPMLTAGDELGRTQRGNNNAYCQDNQISWTDWDLDAEQEALLEFTRALIRVRRELGGGLGAAQQLLWFDASGAPMTEQTWQDPGQRILQVLWTAGGRVRGLLVVHRGLEPGRFVLPRPEQVHAGWSLAQVLSTVEGTARAGARLGAGEQETICPTSITLYTP